jgi:hypothetical protein
MKHISNELKNITLKKVFKQNSHGNIRIEAQHDNALVSVKIHKFA